jgi:hypothetical protein
MKCFYFLLPLVKICTSTHTSDMEDNIIVCDALQVCLTVNLLSFGANKFKRAFHIIVIYFIT